MLEVLGDLKESCRLLKSQLPPSLPHQLSTPTGSGSEGDCEARFLSEVPEREKLAVRQGGRVSVPAPGEGDGRDVLHRATPHRREERHVEEHTQDSPPKYFPGVREAGWLLNLCRAAWVQGR